MSAPSLLTISGLSATQIEITTTAHDERQRALALASRVTAVTDALDADECADALRAVTALVKSVESARVEIGRPVLELTRKINDTAKDFVSTLSSEKARLENILGEYQAAERAKADRLRREAQDEADRLAREAARAATVADRASTSVEADRAQQAAAQAETAAIEARVAVATIAPTKPEGVAVRATWKFEVTDIKALFAARPDLCVIEPNNAGIRAQIPHNQNIPGLRIWKEAKASIR